MFEKTNALRLLDQEKIPYSTSSYDVKDGKVDGKSVAEKSAGHRRPFIKL